MGTSTLLNRRVDRQRHRRRIAIQTHLGKGLDHSRVRPRVRSETTIWIRETTVGHFATLARSTTPEARVPNLTQGLPVPRPGETVG